MARGRIGELVVDVAALDARLSLVLLPGSFTVPWSQCGATADFLASYAAGLVEEAGGPAADELSSMVNELLENAIKFGGIGPIDITVGTRGGDVFCVVKNPVVAEEDELAAKLEALLRVDPAEALVARVEENATQPHGSAGIGLLGLRADYGVELAFEVANDGRPGVIVVETMARMPGTR